MISLSHKDLCYWKYNAESIYCKPIWQFIILDKLNNGFWETQYLKKVVEHFDILGIGWNINHNFSYICHSFPGNTLLPKLYYRQGINVFLGLTDIAIVEHFKVSSLPGIKSVIFCMWNLSGNNLYTWKA